MQHHKKGKLREANGKTTGCGLADVEVARINDEIDGFKTEREKINEEREHDHLVAIKRQAKQVGMDVWKSARKKIIQIHSKLRALQARLPAACTEQVANLMTACIWASVSSWMN